MSFSDRPVMLVDDEAPIRAALAQMLELRGYRPLPFASGETALAALSRDFAGVIVTDLRMPGLSGSALFARVRDLDPDLPVIVLTGHGDIPGAVELMKKGAYDFLSKPPAVDRLVEAIERGMEKRRLVLENRRLRELAEAGAGAGPGIDGTSPFAARLRAEIGRLAPGPAPVLVMGEPGSGRSHVAALLHRASSRADRPLTVIDGSALDPEHPERELFGHASGAFPGATMPRTGRLRQADGGTVVLDRLTRLPLRLQRRIAEWMRTGTFQPEGAAPAVSADCRVIGIARPELAAEVEAGRFDRTLYYQFAGSIVALPPLRERREDAEILFHRFLEAAAARAGRPVPEVGAADWARLRGYDWPGNLAELRAEAEARAVGETGPEGAAADEGGLRDAVARFEAERIRAALLAAGGDVEAAREALMLPRKTLYDKMARHGITPAAFRPAGR